MSESTKKHTSSEIYDYLKKALLSGVYSPGEHITELEIASKFGTSRTPVREAFHKLSADGLLFLNQNKSMETMTYDNKTIGQLGIMRLQLDILSSKLAIYYGSNFDFLKMKEIAMQCCEAESKGEHAEAVALDAKFHISLAQNSKNVFLYEMQSKLWLRTQYILVNEGKTATVDYDQRIKLHLDIVDALMERNEAKTIAMIKDHLLAKYDLTEDLQPNFIENL